MPREKRPSNIDVQKAVSNIRKHLKAGDMKSARVSTKKLLSYLAFLGLLSDASEIHLNTGPSNHCNKHSTFEEKVTRPSP